MYGCMGRSSFGAIRYRGEFAYTVSLEFFFTEMIRFSIMSYIDIAPSFILCRLETYGIIIIGEI